MSEQPVDELISHLRSRLPSARVERLKVTHPADDDNLWFVRVGATEVQFDCHPGGQPPFLIEGEKDERHSATSVGDALAVIEDMLRG